MSRSKSISMPENEYASVSVRKIENGFIVSRSYSGPKGYASKEEYSATKPKLDIAAPKPAAAKPKAGPMAAVIKAGGKVKGR